MRRLIILLFIVLLSIVLGVKVAQDPGYALFVYQQWSVEMPLWLTLVASIIFLILFYSIIRLFDHLQLWGLHLRLWQRQRKRCYAHRGLYRGLIELVEENWSTAENDLLAKVKCSDTPLLNYLFAAKAAQAQKKFDQRDYYISQAYRVSPKSNMAIGITKAKLQFQQGQLDQALVTIDQLRNIKKISKVITKHPAVLNLLYQIYLSLNYWPQLAELLPKLKQLKILDSTQWHDVVQHVALGLLNQAKTTEQLTQQWRSLSKEQRNISKVLLVYAQRLKQFKQLAQTERVLVQYLAHHWDEAAVLFYAELSLDCAKQLKQAEYWYKKQANSPALNFALARFSEQLQLWGQAKNYYQASLALDKLTIVYKYYIEFLVNQKELEQAVQMSLLALYV